MTNRHRSRPAQRLRELLSEGRLILAPSATDGLSAKLIANAGFDAIHLTGSVLFVEAPETREEVEQMPKRVNGPVLINMYSGGKTPLVSTAELRAWGYRIVVWPSHLQRASIMAMQRALELLKRDDVSAADDPDLMVSFSEREDLVGMPEYQTLERRFLR